jgi:hypothetical protein
MRRAHLHLPPSTQRRPAVHSLTILNAIFAYDSQNPRKGRKERERGKRKDGKAGGGRGGEPVSDSRAVPSSSLFLPPSASVRGARGGFIPPPHTPRQKSDRNSQERTLSSTTSSKAEDQNIRPRGRPRTKDNVSRQLSVALRVLTARCSSIRETAAPMTHARIGRLVRRLAR